MASTSRVVGPPWAQRILAEYREMPGLRLTLRQASRLWALDVDLCKSALDALVAAGRLQCDAKGHYCLGQEMDMTDHTMFEQRGRSLEDEYFRKREAELIARQEQVHADAQAASARASASRALAEALGVSVTPGNGSLRSAIDTLVDAGVGSQNAAVVEWLPALEVAWEGGVDLAERDRLLALAALGRAPADVAACLSDWCDRRPAPEVFAAARVVLRYHVEHLDSHERTLLLDRVIGACDTTARASGGWTGFRRVSANESRVLQDIRAALTGGVAPAF